MRTLELLFPLVKGIELAIAGAVSFIYVQMQKKGLAIARSLGTTKAAVMAMILTEIILWQGVGVLIFALLCSLTSIDIKHYSIILGIDIASIFGACTAGCYAVGKKAQHSLKEDE